LFEDETDLLLFPPLRAGWAQRGKSAEVPLSGRNARWVVFGAVAVRRESDRGTILKMPRRGEE